MSRRSLHDARVRDETLARFRTIPADRAPHWGRMTAPKMVVHCTEALRMATGDLPIRVLPIGRVLGATGIGTLMARHLPFPKGAPTHPKLMARVPTTIADELAQLATAMERFAAKPMTDRWAPHPLFGGLSARTWGVLAWRHLDHHLRQFGA
jgi:hypothetical protein